ncbi:hypothetical protein [Micromonospora sp. NPDC049374]|uniref:hypothetical protein n=1 Tax=Micromonospora sp. NPDC049374 TaxID=3154352 RepID=UPI0034187DA8
MNQPVHTATAHPTNGRAHQHTTPPVDNMPPTRSKITGGLAALACAACCAIPLLIAAAVLAAALGMWWLRRRHRGWLRLRRMQLLRHVRV